MQTINLWCFAGTKRSASALLGLVIVIALVLLVYFAQLYMKSTTKDPDLCDDLTPWKEWRLSWKKGNLYLKGNRSLT